MARRPQGHRGVNDDVGQGGHIVDRTDDLKNWAASFRQFLSRNLKVYAYANNHYAGHGPGTVKLFWDMLEKK